MTSSRVPSDQRDVRVLQNSKVDAPFLCFCVFLRIFKHFQNEKVSFVTLRRFCRHIPANPPKQRLRRGWPASFPGGAGDTHSLALPKFNRRPKAPPRIQNKKNAHEPQNGPWAFFRKSPGRFTAKPEGRQAVTKPKHSSETDIISQRKRIGSDRDGLYQRNRS